MAEPRTDVTVQVSDDAVLVRDVGPRDGLQSIDQSIPLNAKVALVEGLANAGVRRIEVGSFVSPAAVPQMAESTQVFDATREWGASGPLREALVVNERGALAAIAAGADVLVSVVSVSETFSERNVRMSTTEAVAEMAKISTIATDASVPLSINLSASFGCAFEGDIPIDAVADVADAIAALGVAEILLADTIGAAAPNDMCTEDLVHLFHALGLQTGIDLNALIDVAASIETELGVSLPSKMLRAGPRFTRLAT